MHFLRFFADNAFVRRMILQCELNYFDNKTKWRLSKKDVLVHHGSYEHDLF